MIGILIAVWIIAGVVPYLISLGLELLSGLFCPPPRDLRRDFIATGSSWTTATSYLMGVGNGLALQPAMVAGAVVSGAYFGDKMSPLSDSTNLRQRLQGGTVRPYSAHGLYNRPRIRHFSGFIFNYGYFNDQSDTSSGEVLKMQAIQPI